MGRVTARVPGAAPSVARGLNRHGGPPTSRGRDGPWVAGLT